MAAVNPAALLRKATTNKIANVLRRPQDSIPNAGLFGASGSLPTDPGPIDPPILTGGPGPSYVPSGPVNPNDLWTRIDPNMGYIDPSVTINPANPADAPSMGPIQGPAEPEATPRQSGGNNSPANHLVTHTHSPGQPSAPLWFQRGYQPPAGIQAAIARGDYQTAYGQSPSSATANFIADNQRFGGNPNSMPVPDAGPNRFYNGIMQMDAEGGFTDLGPRLSGVRRPTARLSPELASILAYNRQVTGQ